ncbi:MAG: VWA domain-containing protein [Ignavibacteriaceae bacterium]|nr:VWA domain-containing protein [Ignavibacteriaceae bacterium]
MFGYEDIQLSIAYSAAYLIIAFILIALYSFYVYRFTIPHIHPYKKVLLVTLRVLALIVLCLILFEPILNLSKKITIEPGNLVFIDDSRSLKIDDGSNRTEAVQKILSDFSFYASESNITFLEFGSSVRDVGIDSLEKINFSDGATNLQDIFNYVRNSDKNIASITLVTDGVITSGSNPYYDARNLGIPVFTIGIGDTTKRKDVELKKVLHNDFLYSETPTNIIATISNKGFVGESVTATLYEDNKFISKQTVILSDAGIQNISFDYKAQTSGEKKLSIQLSSLTDEFTSANNKQVFYVNILSNKIKVLLLATSPSADLTFIKNSLGREENVEVNSIVQISRDKFLDQLNYQILDSADVLFLIGFPSDATPEELLIRVISKIKERKTPYLLTLSAGVSLARLSRIGNDLPFTMMQNLTGFREIQPYIPPEQVTNPILQQTDKNLLDGWNNLPPVLQPNAVFSARIESKTLVQIKLNNNIVKSPLILSKNFSGKRSIAVLAKDIWKWKLQIAPKGLDLFDSFIINSLRWLRASEEQKLVKINTSRKNFSQGERIEFSGEVFDEALTPISDAGIKINISSQKNKYETDMQNVGPGLYEGSIVINETGDFNFSAEAVTDNRVLGKDNGSFNIGEIDIEMVNPVMNYPLLNLLAKDSGGEFYFSDDYSPILNKLRELRINSSKEKMVTSEITLWSDTWMLGIAILLFALEWFIRKRSGML